MSMRTTCSIIRFSRPFLLTGIDDEQPAGSYTVETDEELIQHVSIAAYRRVSTLIRLPPRPGSTELARIVDLAPPELAALLASDAKMDDTPAVFSARGAAAPQPATAVPVPALAKGWRAGGHSWAALNANELTWAALVAGGVVLALLFAGR